MPTPAAYAPLARSTPAPVRGGGPFLVGNPLPPHRTAPWERTLQLWHLLSLDAPSVAVVWMLFVARAAGVALPLTSSLAMFAAVWMLYASDRLLDSRALLGSTANSAGLEERHHFHFRHRGRFRAGLVVAAIALAILVHFLDLRALDRFAVLSVLLAAWFLLIHARFPSAAEAHHRLPKELAVGIFFPAAVFIPSVARAPQLQGALLPAALLFACVCTLNCLFLFAWEHPHGSEHAHWTTRWASERLHTLGTCAVLAGLGMAAAARWWPRAAGTHPALAHPDALPLACAASAALLLGLHRGRRRFARLSLRALADLALLTPLFWLAVRP